ncbi:phosphodiesterase [Nocardioides mangrovicus]|uniref:Phosphodiesterase n=1 Tax=Nocardioides mangrovicus TaxID=2478913 RepID=A0A3L8P132_9ACTN|nr:GGDEF domain-containing phosphodiesterase [Nocardioides mangrovicus]RLV48637.1 phosphodiesterase [Nocardioides mangrovicus]
MSTLQELRGLMAGLSAGLQLQDTMAAVAHGVVAGLGFGVAAISMVQRDGSLEVTAVSGEPAAVTALQGLRSPRSEWDRMLAAAEALGPTDALRLLRHDQADVWDEDLVPSWVPEPSAVEPSADGRRAWHELDSLFAPLYSPDERLLAVLSVDLPPGGLEPTQEMYALLELFAAQASTALEHARLHTDLMAAHEAARTALATRLEGLIDASPAAIVEVDRQGLVSLWSKSAETILGLSAADVVGAPLPQRADRPLDLHAVFSWLEAGEALPLSYLGWTRPDGDTVRLEVSASATHTPAGELHGVMALLSDVSDRHRLEQEVLRHYTHDALTGLPNRAVLVERLTQQLTDRDSCVAVMVVDLDGFADINDSLGHDLGDHLLQAVARRLGESLRADDLLVRIAGDQFAILLGDAADATDVTARCHQTLRALHRTFDLGGLPVDVEVSIGLASAEQDDAEQVLRRADLAMHEAKSTSSGLVTLTAAEIAPPSDRVRLLGELRRALENDELVVFFQPQVEVTTGALCGVEALVRWQHPRHGLLLPGSFLHVAENTALVGPLTSRVLDLACAQMQTWSAAGRDISVAVNLSARSLYDRRLVHQVRTSLDRYSVAPGRLRLEVTESAVMHDPRRALAVLTELADDGIPLSLDDFGTGFSSMSHLRMVPARELKIDRSFVRDMVREPDDAVLVRSTVDLAHNLGLAVVAEGVEDEQTLRQLERLGCDVMQGYHIGRPMRVDEFEDWLEARAPVHSSEVPAPVHG